MNPINIRAEQRKRGLLDAASSALATMSVLSAAVLGYAINQGDTGPMLAFGFLGVVCLVLSFKAHNIAHAPIPGDGTILPMEEPVPTIRDRTRPVPAREKAPAE